MHKIEGILFGIALILFGIASILIADITQWGFFEVLGVICPFLGLASAIIGLFDRGGSDSNDDNT